MKIALRYKFTGIVLLAVLPFLVYGTLDYIDTVNENKAVAISRTQAIAEETAEKLERFIQSSQNILYSLATNPAIIALDSKRSDEIFARLLPLYTTYENIIAADMQGNNFGSGLEPAKARKLRYLDREWFRKGINGVSSVSDVYVSKLLEHHVFMVSMPVFDKTGTQTAVLGLAANLNKLQQYFIEIEKIAPKYAFSIVDSKGRLLVDSKNQNNIGLAIKPQSLLQRTLKESSGSFNDFDISGNEHFFSHATVNSTGWKVITSQPLNEVYAEANSSALKHFIVFFIASASGIFLSLNYSKKIGGKVEILIKGFNEGSSGNLDHKVNIQGNDEFTYAATAFNRMLVERKLIESEIKQLAESLEKRVVERTTELLAAKNALEAFSYTVSHDLQAPARHVIAFSRIILQDHSEELSVDTLCLLHRISRAGERMKDLITHLLALSSLDRKKLACSTTNLSSLCRNIVSELQEINPERHVKFIIDDSLSIYADPVMLEIAIRNLLENSWKFTTKSANPEIEVGFTAKDGRSCYFIKDNGCGFDMDYADKLFLPFHKLHAELDYEGIGVGLSTVFRIVALHGGFIFAESRQNEGTVFYFNMRQQ